MIALLLICLAIICILAGAAQSQAPVSESAYTKGVSLYNTRKFADALAIFETGKIDSTQAANAAYYRALCYHQLGRIKEAAAAYRYVFSKYPQSPAAKNSLKTLAVLDPASAAAAIKNLDVPRTGKIDWSGLPEHVAVPFKRGHGGMIVNAEMGGVPVTMVFDTGASSTTCTETFLATHNIKVKRTNIHGRALGVGGEVPTTIAMVDLKVGDLKRQIPLTVQDNRNMPDTFPLPLLGQTFFSDLPYSVDDAHDVIVFSKPAETNLANSSGTSQSKPAQRPKLLANEVPFRRDGGNIVVTVSVNGRECEMYFDTGADILCFADRHLAACGLNRPTSAYQGQGGGVGAKREAFGFTVDSVKVGNVERKHVRAGVLINANFDRPLLGQSFLSGLRYTIDPAKNCIRFE
jgi:clan AA aspartic protease (TIGR02281 family)